MLSPTSCTIDLDIFFSRQDFDKQVKKEIKVETVLYTYHNTIFYTSNENGTKGYHIPE